MPPIPAPPRGPYVQAGLICEKVLQEGDGVASLIRVIDRLHVTAVGPAPPVQMPPQQPELFLIVMVKSGETRGRHALKIRPEAPSGEQRPTLEVHLNLEGEERGTTVNVGLQGFTFDLEGLWWFDVLFGDDETLMTRIPLRLVYQPQQVQMTTEPPQS